MTHALVAVRFVIVGVLAASLASLPSPAPAAPVSSTLTQPDPLYVGDDHEEGPTTFETVSFTAGGGQASVFPTVMENRHLARIVDVDVVVGGLTHDQPR